MTLLFGRLLAIYAVCCAGAFAVNLVHRLDWEPSRTVVSILAGGVLLLVLSGIIPLVAVVLSRFLRDRGDVVMGLWAICAVGLTSFAAVSHI
jgi:hypothetical protein